MKIATFLLNLVLLHPGLILGKRVVPVLSLTQNTEASGNETITPDLEYLPFITLIDYDKDTSEYWRETEILSLIRSKEMDIDYDKCEKSGPVFSLVQIPSRRTIRPICKTRIDYQLCPQCPHFNNHTECELFRDSCRERRVHPSEYGTYCDSQYGKWRTMFLPADYSQCRCCDECILYRELDQSCMEDEYNFDVEEFLPVTTIDFRAGCNPYWGHPEQEQRALRCDKNLRRCVPMSIPSLPNNALNIRRSFRYERPTGGNLCPVSCRGFACTMGQVQESGCPAGAFIPDKERCNCCGHCSSYQQLNQKCAEFKKTIHEINGTKEIEVEEEFLEPGCDDGLVCRQGKCQDIHTVMTSASSRKKRDENIDDANEPCKREMKYFKKKYGPDGHLHYEAPQCTPLWLYAPVQCRRFICYCALEDGSIIQGIKVPRVEVSNMNCDCAREKCRTGSDVECDGFGNYKEALFSPLSDKEGVDLYREITFRNSGQTYRGVPVMASNMDTVGTFEMARELSKHGLFTCIHKYYTIDEWKKFAADYPDCLEQMAASSGTAEADFERLSEILDNVKDLKFVCLDVANGYSQHFVEYVRRVRAAYPTHTIIAGNVVTGEMVEELILSGADIIKVGIGPGSVCTTRIKTGVGYPQLSAVIECADAAHGLKGHIISDGGCTCPGDVAKAFGAGADFVMAGGMFAGHDQCGGEVVTTGDGRRVKLFYGMSSSTAMLKHSGVVADYRSSEGKTVEVEYRGDVGATVKDILGGLRSACTYVGASHLRELPRRATFIRCCRQVNDSFS